MERFKKKVPLKCRSNKTRKISSLYHTKEQINPVETEESDRKTVQAGCLGYVLKRI